MGPHVYWIICVSVTSSESKRLLMNGGTCDFKFEQTSVSHCIYPSHTKPEIVW